MKKWEATYKGHEIRIEAGIFGKRLFIDGKLKAAAGLGRNTQLVARIEQGEGVGESLMAMFQGLWPSGCDLATKEDEPSSEESKARAFNVIRGEGPTSVEAWKEAFAGFRRKFPNLASYDDRELGEILKKNGVKSTQVFGERQLVEINLESQTVLGKTISEALLDFPAKDSR